MALQSPMAASRLVDRLLDRTETLLADNPGIGRSGRVTGTRELVMTGLPYIVVYRISDQVEVPAVVHGARAWPDTFS